MNSTPNIVVLWYTKNIHRKRNAKKWCKDFGMQRIQTNLYAGILSQKEKREIDKKFSSLLTGKKEWYYLFTTTDFPQCTTENTETRKLGFVIIRN